MSWKKREPVSNLVVLGDDEGQVRTVGGLLASITQDQVYPSRSNYEIVQKNGESIWLAGSASLGRQIFPADVGKFMKAQFQGWGKSANGKFKDIEVNIWEGEPNEAMKAWPRFDEFANGAAPSKATVKASAKAEKADDFDDFPDAPDDDDPDALPF